MRNRAEAVKKHLRAKGFTVLDFYGSANPEKGWLKVWWSCPPGPRHGLNAVIDRLPYDPAKAEAMKREFNEAMAELGWRQNLRPGDDKRVWVRKEGA